MYKQPFASDTETFLISLNDSHAGTPAGGSAARSEGRTSTAISGQNLAAIASPAERMGAAARHLRRQVKRDISDEELLDFYESNGLNTGEDTDGNRGKLAQKNAEYVNRTFIKNTGEGYHTLSTHLLSLISIHVTESIRQTIRQKNRSQYTDDQLAVILFTVDQTGKKEKRNPAHKNTVPNNSLDAMLTTLGYPLTGSETARRNTLAACKQALEAAALIEVMDDVAYKRGQGKRYQTGRNFTLK